MGEISLMILNGPYHFGASFVAWKGRWRFFPSSHTWLPDEYWARGIPDRSATLFRAIVACAHHCSIILICSSTVLLMTDETRSGLSKMSYPSKTWLGNKLVVLFLWLLWTMEASANHWVQSLGAADVTSQRYCSTHWFFYSKRPSI